MVKALAAIQLLVGAFCAPGEAKTWAYQASMLQNVGWMGAAGVNNSVYIAGGSVYGSSPEASDVEVLKFPGYSWKSAPAMPKGIMQNHLAATAYKGKLYVVGGNSEMITTCTDVRSFDGTAWSQHPGMTTCRYYHALAASAGWLFAVGGYGYGDGNASQRSLEIFDGQAWVRVPSQMALPRGKLAAVVYKGFLYVLGGLTGMPYSPNTATNSVEIYEVGKYASSYHHWLSAPSMPTHRSGHNAAVFDGKIYVVGGNDIEGKFLSSVDIFDGERWSSGPPMLTARGGFGLAFLSYTNISGGAEEALFAIGGFTGDRLPNCHCINTVEALGLPDFGNAVVV